VSVSDFEHHWQLCGHRLNNTNAIVYLSSNTSRSDHNIYVS
jgi:hypothetical protein